MGIPKKIKLGKTTYIKVDEESIGEGSYGEVWKMKRSSDSVLVAVKTIKNISKKKGSLKYLSKQARKNLEKEIDFLHQLKNPVENFILPVLDHGLFDDDLYMVMPLADYCLDDIYDLAETNNLSKKDVEFTPKRLFKWTIQITTGLQHIHRTINKEGKPHVHRDFKLSNVLIKEDNAYLCDFGSIKAKKDEDLTNSHIFTIGFAAPEFLIPKKFEDNEERYLYETRSDIFSLGVSLYYLITQDFRTKKSQLDYQKKLKECIGNDPDNLYMGVEKHFGKIGGLLEEERLKLEDNCFGLFGINKLSESTHIGFPAVMLPNKVDIAEKIVNLISTMLSPLAKKRPDTKTIINIMKELQELYFPELKSLSLKSKKYIEEGEPIDLLIHAKGKGLLIDGSWMYITLQSPHKSIISKNITFIKKNQWKATLKEKLKPGRYSLNVFAYINDKEIHEQTTIEVLNKLELSSLSIQANDFVEKGKPVIVNMTIIGKSLRKKDTSWLYVVIKNSQRKHKANKIIYEKNNQWKAIFNKKLESGSYTITVMPKIKDNEEFIKNADIQVLDDPLTLWNSEKYFYALIQDSKHTNKWITTIEKKSKKNEETRQKWFEILEQVLKYNKDNEDYQILYWKLKKLKKCNKKKIHKRNWLPYIMISLILILSSILTIPFIVKKSKNEFIINDKISKNNIKNIPSLITPVEGLEFVYIEGGYFEINSEYKYLDSFYIGKYEIRQRDYRTFMVSENYTGDNQAIESSLCKGLAEMIIQQNNNHPVVCVTLDDIQVYAQWLTEKNNNYVFSLPTEAEWEYSCRNRGKNIKYSWGDQTPVAQKSHPYGARFDDKSFGAVAVGSYRSNDSGLFDMCGNVWEWCLDDIRIDTSYILKGGSWLKFERDITCSSRETYDTDKRGADVGFRLVCKPSKK